MIRISPLAALLVVLLATPPGRAEAQTASLDLDRFDGRWFEIERSHNTIQRDCRRAQIDFTPRQAPRRYDILVTCVRIPGGHIETVRANARIADDNPAKFRFTLTGLLSFGGLAGQNYWVFDKDPDYRWAILALPDKSDWWIWHRDQNADQGERDRLLARARALGLPMSRVIRTPPN